MSQNAEAKAKRSYAKKGAIDRFISEVVLRHESPECLPWPYARSRNGYPHIRRDGKTQSITRIICERAHGPAPTPEHEAAHSCGNGHLGCVNKNHLSWKTHAENEADKERHGTRPRGESISWSVLTERTVSSIRAWHRIGEPQVSIAKRLNIDKRMVNDIVLRKSWRHVV